MPVPPRRPAKKAPAAKAPAAVKNLLPKTAPKAPAAKVRSAGADVPKYEFPMQQYLDKEPTKVHTNFVTWAKEQTGYDVDLKTVQLAFVLRIQFQKSEQNQEDLGSRRSAAAEKKTDKPVVKVGPVKRGPIGRKKAAVEETVEEAAEVEAAPEVEEIEEAPVKPTRPATRRATKSAPAKTPAKAAPPARGRKVATPKAAAAEEDAF